MSDVLNDAQRRLCMSHIRGKDTKPEMVVRSIAHRMGFRFRLHVRGLPGTPDLVFPSRHKIILVHGCFWHMHHCRYGRVTPQTNRAFWERKRTGTVERDQRNSRMLREAGWDVLEVWECQTRQVDDLARRLETFLRVRAV